jgi:hypothetical protein
MDASHMRRFALRFRTARASGRRPEDAEDGKEKVEVEHSETKHTSSMQSTYSQVMVRTTSEAAPFHMLRLHITGG